VIWHIFLSVIEFSEKKQPLRLKDNYLKLALIAKLSSVVLNCLSAMFSAKQPVPLGSYLLSLQLFSFESPT
jgi:hypothetical protein